MKFVKAIVCVVVATVLLLIPFNGDDGERLEGDSPESRRVSVSADARQVGRTRSGVRDGLLYDGGDTARAGGASSVVQWSAWPESASVEFGERVRFSCAVLVFSTPEEVWGTLVTARRFFLWYPHWKREADLMRRLAAVGDTVGYFRNDRLAGRSVVAELNPLERLEVSHELYSGRWAGSILVSMEAADRGIGLLYEELLPSAGLKIDEERSRVCKQALLIKRLAEGE